MLYTVQSAVRFLAVCFVVQCSVKYFEQCCVAVTVHCIVWGDPSIDLWGPHYIWDCYTALLQTLLTVMNTANATKNYQLLFTKQSKGNFNKYWSLYWQLLMYLLNTVPMYQCIYMPPHSITICRNTNIEHCTSINILRFTTKAIDHLMFDNWFRITNGSILWTYRVIFSVPVMVKDPVTVTDPKSVTVTSTSDILDDSGWHRKQLICTALHCTALPCNVNYNPVEHCTCVMYSVHCFIVEMTEESVCSEHEEQSLPPLSITTLHCHSLQE